MMAITAAPAKQDPAYTMVALYCPLATAKPDLGGPLVAVRTTASLACCKLVEIGVDRMFPTPRVSNRMLNIVVASDGSSSARRVQWRQGKWGENEHKMGGNENSEVDALATGRTNAFHMLDQQPAVVPYTSPYARMPASE